MAASLGFKWALMELVCSVPNCRRLKALPSEGTKPALIEVPLDHLCPSAKPLKSHCANLSPCGKLLVYIDHSSWTGSTILHGQMDLVARTCVVRCAAYTSAA